MSRGAFVILTQDEADQRTLSDGIQRYIGEQVHAGTRTDKPDLNDDPVNYEWVPGSILVGNDWQDNKRPDKYHAWNFPDWQPHAQIKARDKRKPRPLSAIVADIQGLSTADDTKLDLAIKAEFLRSHPRFARKLNIPIDGDEPE